MTAPEFLEIFRELIQTDAEMEMNTALEDIEEWDSMAMMAIAAHFDARYDIQIPFDQLNACSTPADIARLAPDFEE